MVLACALWMVKKLWSVASFAVKYTLTCYCKCSFYMFDPAGFLVSGDSQDVDHGGLANATTIEYHSE